MGMDDLLAMEEMQSYYIKPKDEDTAISLNNYSGAWHVVEKGETVGSDKKIIQTINKIEREVDVIFDINLHVKRGRLIGICGGVGSGKTSLVSSLLGQINKKKGSLEMQGSLA